MILVISLKMLNIETRLMRASDDEYNPIVKLSMKNILQFLLNFDKSHRFD